MEQNIPEKYRFKNYNKTDKDIFNFDTQGWPLFKQNVRDILIGFGLSYNKETNKWEISEDDPRMDCPISVLFDDGMGYGVNEHFISEASAHIGDERIGKTFANVFIEKPMDNIEVWKNASFKCGDWVKKKENIIYAPSNHFILREVKETDEGKFVYLADQYFFNEDDSNLLNKEISLFNGDNSKLLNKGVSLSEEEIEFDND